MLFLFSSDKSWLSARVSFPQTRLTDGSPAAAGPCATSGRGRPTDELPNGRAQHTSGGTDAHGRNRSARARRPGTSTVVGADRLCVRWPSRIENTSDKVNVRVKTSETYCFASVTRLFWTGSSGRGRLEGRLRRRSVGASLGSVSRPSS